MNPSEVRDLLTVFIEYLPTTDISKETFDPE